MPRDLLERYKALTPVTRIAELKCMLQEVFSRLEEHSGASLDELILLAAGVQRHCEQRRADLRDKAKEQDQAEAASSS